MNAKIDSKELVNNWNQVVDDYIASGVDHRGRRIIENAAKIGVAGGPLFRRCEADGCANVEGRNGVKLLVCSGCKMVCACGNLLCRRLNVAQPDCLLYQELPKESLAVSQVGMQVKNCQGAGPSISAGVFRSDIAGGGSGYAHVQCRDFPTPF